LADPFLFCITSGAFGSLFKFGKPVVDRLELLKQGKTDEDERKDDRATPRLPVLGGNARAPG
jgi:hypothetical protein